MLLTPSQPAPAQQRQSVAGMVSADKKADSLTTSSWLYVAQKDKEPLHSLPLHLAPCLHYPMLSPLGQQRLLMRIWWSAGDWPDLDRTESTKVNSSRKLVSYNSHKISLTILGCSCRSWFDGISAPHQIAGREGRCSKSMLVSANAAAFRRRVSTISLFWADFVPSFTVVFCRPKMVRHCLFMMGLNDWQLAWMRWIRISWSLSHVERYNALVSSFWGLRKRPGSGRAYPAFTPSGVSSCNCDNQTNASFQAAMDGGCIGLSTSMNLLRISFWDLEVGFESSGLNVSTSRRDRKSGLLGKCTCLSLFCLCRPLSEVGLRVLDGEEVSNVGRRTPVSDFKKSDIAL